MLTYLYLLLITSSDVRNSPASFLLNALLMVMGQKVQETWECLMIDDILQNKKSNQLNEIDDVRK